LPPISHCDDKKLFKKMPNLSFSRPLVRRVSRGKESALQEAVMARQHSLIQNLKSIAGVGLIGLGVFILFGNLTDAAAQLSYLLGITAEGEKTLGVLNTVGLAASHALQAYLFAHKEFLRGLYRILISFWPLLLVIAGTALLPDGFTDEVQELPKKTTAYVDLTAPRSTRK
jgi:hypothetical protein